MRRRGRGDGERRGVEGEEQGRGRILMMKGEERRKENKKNVR